MSFIESLQNRETCVFCEIGGDQDGKDEELLVLERGKSCFVVLNKYPYANGHLMVIPYRHTGSWEDLEEPELFELARLTQSCVAKLSKAIKPQGFNLGVNMGKAAGAGIEDHIHQHIVPRWNGDFNFMPLFGETKVIAEHIEATYARLKEVWEGA